MENKKIALTVGLTAIICFSLGFFTFFNLYNIAWQRNADLGLGLYFDPPYQNGVQSETIGVHVDVWHTSAATGVRTHLGHSAGVMTNIGYDFVQDELFDGGSATTDSADYISLSSDASSPAVGWTQLVSEINANGLTRALGTYARTSSTVCTIEKTFTATGSQANVQLVGFQWSATPVSDNNLMWADTFTPVSLATDDTLTVTATITLSNP